jgi:hypothetical protein
VDIVNQAAAKERQGGGRPEFWEMVFWWTSARSMKKEGIRNRKLISLILLGLIAGLIAGMIVASLAQYALRDKTPNLSYARKKGLSEKHQDIILPLDSNEQTDENKKAFIDTLVSYQDALNLPVVKEMIKNITADGKITSEELNFTKTFLPEVTKFLNAYPDFAKYVGNDIQQFNFTLGFYEKHPEIFSEIYRNCNNDARINIDRNALTYLTLKLFSELGYNENVKVLDPKTGNYVIKPINPSLIHVIGNYTTALMNDLPRHSNEDIWLLGNATMINPEIYDFEPVTVKDMNGIVYEIGSKNIPRDTWILVEHLKRTPYVVKYPELYLPFTIKVQQNAFDLLEQEHPLWKCWGEKYKPTDEIIWEKVIIPQWNYYWESFPQSGNISKRIIVFPIYNSTLLKQLIPHENDLKIALMIFWGFSDLTCNGVADLNADWNDLYHGKGFHRGLDAMAYTIQVLPEVYNRVMSLYPNKTVPFSKYNPEPMDIRFDYYSWIGDRGWHGLRNMFKQFMGFYIADWGDIVDKVPLTEFHKYVVQNYDGINTYLFKNFEKYDIIAFVIGYNTYSFGPDLGQDYFWGYALKAFGIPSLFDSFRHEHYINAPARYAMSQNTCIFGLPENVLKPLREGEYGKVVILPGNGICPVGSAIEGIEKDMEYGNEYPVYPNLKYAEIALPLRGYRIYFFKIGK